MIDYWCNAFTPDRADLWQAVIEQDELTIKLGAREDDIFTTAELMVARMNQTAISTLVLPVCDLPPGAPLDEFAHYVLRPDEIRQLSAAYPGRFVGMFSITPTRGDADLEAADEALHAVWCVGVHSHTHSWDLTFDAPGMSPYYALAAKHGVPMVMQAGASGGPRIHELGHPAAIEGPAEEFPMVAFVLSHLGIPWLTDTIRVARNHDNVMIGTATHPPARWPAELLDYVRGEGAEKVLFGTGYPLTGHVHVQAQLDALDISPATKEALRDGNARRIFTRIPQRVGG
ncbi:MAG: putative TIM-barrel fold metal-dependent hydrolase [Candidatus Aldehydirespiratoraceae bacterium]|jgi:predicted TIM-barrel fold metal-dependent hydrolase